MDENYMSYAANTWMFTHDQVAVMQATLNGGYRNSLRNSISNGTTVNCGAIVGLENLKETQFNIYPNPSNGYLKIDVNQKENIKKISIRNILGELVYAKEYQNTEPIDISNLVDGIYFIDIYTNNRSSTHKIILNRNAKN